MMTLPALFALSACVIGANKYPRPRDLSPTWLVDGTRLLAVRADPPEARPGEGVSFEALIGTAPGTTRADLGVIWLACPVDDEGNGFGCLTDLGALDLDNPDPAVLAELGFIGFEPGLPPFYVVPLDLLDALPTEDRAEGSYVLVQVMAFPNDLVNEPLDDIDFSTVASGYKRLVVSESTTPNHNPPIGAFTVDGFVVPDGATVYVEPDQAYGLGILLPDGTRELYEYVNRDGLVEERVEEPYSNWYSTGGEVLEDVTLWPYMESTWIAPTKQGERGTFYVVLRDRRGGMTFTTRQWQVGSP